MTPDSQAGVPQTAGRAPAELLPLVYEELRELAGHYLRNERTGHTFQPTALVHEAYLRLAQGKNQHFSDAGQFFRTAGTVMRHILVNHARDRRRDKRGGDAKRVPFDAVLMAFEEQAIDMLALDEALEKLTRADARQGQVVELRIFCGLTMKEISEAVGRSERTVKDDWYTAKAWLHRELGNGATVEPPQDISESSG